jgi:hypothetical protein
MLKSIAAIAILALIALPASASERHCSHFHIHRHHFHYHRHNPVSTPAAAEDVQIPLGCFPDSLDCH